MLWTGTHNDCKTWKDSEFRSWFISTIFIFIGKKFFFAEWLYPIYTCIIKVWDIWLNNAYNVFMSRDTAWAWVWAWKSFWTFREIRNQCEIVFFRCEKNIHIDLCFHFSNHSSSVQFFDGFLHKRYRYRHLHHTRLTLIKTWYYNPLFSFSLAINATRLLIATHLGFSNSPSLCLTGLLHSFSRS